jgi:hypothetical protein
MDQEAKQVAQMSLLSTLVLRIQKLVSSHGQALEFLREIFIKHDDQIVGLKKEMKEVPEQVSRSVNHSVLVEVEAKTKEFETKLKAVQEELETIKSENADVKKVNAKLEQEVDETRQRGLKGNLLISVPDPNKFKHSRKPDGRLESDTELLCRLIQEKTGVQIPLSEVMACHKLKGERNTYILRVTNHSPGSGWEALNAGMMTGKRQDSVDYFAKDGVFLNYQLTAERSSTLREVRMARGAGHLHKFSVNQNGRITILAEKPLPTQPGEQQQRAVWTEVRSKAHLRQLLPALPTPLTAEHVAARRAEVARRHTVTAPR